MNIEGPEFSQDYSYFIVDMSQDIVDLERGIPLLQDNSLQSIQERDKTMEFRVLERICLHQDHAKNLVVIPIAQFNE